MRSHRWLFLVLLLAVAPAAANTGPPWLFLGFFATWIVPLLLGFIEGGLLQRMIPLSNRRGAAILITANYVSAIFGWATLGLLNLAVGQLPTRWIYLHFPIVLAVVVVLAYLATVVLEWPFHRWAHGPVERPWRAGWRTCLKINLATYVVVAIGFWSLTGIGLYHNARPVADTSFAAGVPAWVYYLNDGELRRIRTDGRDEALVQKLPAKWAAWNRNVMQPQPRLAVRPMPQDGGLGLWIGSGEREPVCLLRNLPGRAAAFPADAERFADFWTRNKAADLRPSDQREWEFRTDFWAEGELEANSNERWVGFQLGTPLVQAFSRYATVLPGDFVVWQLGTQIAVLDFRARRWSILCDGRGPVVVLDGQG